MAQINKPNTYFNSVLYSGNSSTQSITGVNFQPDFTWLKRRSGTAAYHYLIDSIRGGNKVVFSNITNAEETNANAITSFDSDGFSLGSESDINSTGNTFVSWNWLAGGTAVSNTDGSISSTVSANTTSGFSIVSYTYTSGNVTVGHGLGVAPAMIIVKARSVSDNWRIYHKSLGNSAFMAFTTAAQTTGSTAWNSTSPTSSVFSIGSFWGGTDTTIAYCFAEKKGFSKFGSYTGNGSADGTFVYTGFKPAFIIIKATGDTTSWTILDNKRDSYNVTDKRLFTDDFSAEVVSANGNTDFLSNGIKIRTSHLGINTSGGTYIYMAFAENPLVGTNNIPATAR